MKTKFPYRLGLDIGTNSIGWCIYKLDEEGAPASIHRTGVRVFSDGREPNKLKTSKAAARRMARQSRRRHDRVLKRLKRFQQILIENGLMPECPDERKKLVSLDPYELRAKALDEKLPPFELGRALYHLCKRRGFQSSRIDKEEDEKEAGKIKEAVDQTQQMIADAGCRTYGEYLAQQHANRKPVRARPTLDSKGYILYPQRAMVENEFDYIWSAQSQFHPTICIESVGAELKDALLFQRKLRPVEPGSCPFEESEPRIPQCSPLQQKFRILQEINNLRVGTTLDQRPLSLKERDTLLDELLAEPKLSFTRMRKLLGLPKGTPFNLESKKRRELKGDTVSAALASDTALGDSWWQLSDLQREALALLIENALTSTELRKALLALPRDIEPATKIIRGNATRVSPYHNALADLPWSIPERALPALIKAGMPDGYASLSRKALEPIVNELESDVIPYSEAVLRTGYDSHSDFYDGTLYERLPYYGELLHSYTAPMPTAKNADERRFGRIPNPTVHIGLNQVRLIVNEMLRRWGWPQETVIEVAREFGVSGKRRKEIEEEQAANTERNKKLNKRLRDLGQKETRENRQRLLLWDAMGDENAIDRYCIYSGERLSIQKLFSSAVEIDHILPFSRTLDDSLGNKVLCLTSANRYKSNQTPFEAFGNSPGKYDWDKILERASKLPKNKAARFREEAMSDFLNRSGLDAQTRKEYGFEDDEFLARQLNDTRYTCRLARQYLTAICPPNKVWTVSGRLELLSNLVYDHQAALLSD